MADVLCELCEIRKLVIRRRVVVAIRGKFAKLSTVTNNAQTLLWFQIHAAYTCCKRRMFA